MKDYYSLTYRGRIRRLREMAIRALKHYGLPDPVVRVITIETNGIFRVDSTGRKYILRIVDPWCCHDDSELRAEIAWLRALASETNLGVPEPVAAADGSYMVKVDVDGVPESRWCQLFKWVPGSDLGERLNPSNMELYGELAAGLHKHSKNFKLPEGCRLRVMDRVFPWSCEGFSCREPVVLFDHVNCKYMPSGGEIFQKAVKGVKETIDALYTSSSRPRVIHNDLHIWNVKVCRGKIYALDFEDLVLGHPVQDLATTLFHFDGREEYEELAAVFRIGYERVLEWPEQYPGQIDVLKAGRDLVLANWLLCSQNPDEREAIPGYMERAEKRIESYLK